MKCNFYILVMLFALLPSLVARERQVVDPTELPLSTTLSINPAPSKAVIPNELDTEGAVFVAEIELIVQSMTGAAVVLSPVTKAQKCSTETKLKVWDKIKTNPKSEVVLKSKSGAEYRLGADSLAQVISDSAGHFKFRLLQGRVRVINPRVDAVEVESLNAVSTISQGVTDIIISAMNTLIAPREGSKTKVVSFKADQNVAVGDYGLVLADGSLVFTRANRKGKS